MKIQLERKLTSDDKPTSTMDDVASFYSSLQTAQDTFKQYKECNISSKMTLLELSMQQRAENVLNVLCVCSLGLRQFVARSSEQQNEHDTAVVKRKLSDRWQEVSNFSGMLHNNHCSEITSERLNNENCSQQ